MHANPLVWCSATIEPCRFIDAIKPLPVVVQSGPIDVDFCSLISAPRVCLSQWAEDRRGTGQIIGGFDMVVQYVRKHNSSMISQAPYTGHKRQYCAAEEGP